MPRFLACAAALMLLAGPAALAQNAPAATVQASPNAYTGPRFPGGPDSLRAVLRQALRPAKQELPGQLFMRLELDKTGQPSKYSFLTPPDKAGSALARNREVTAVIKQLPAQLGPWQPSTSTTPAQPGNVVVLPLDFGPLPEPLPLLYSDENPVFFSLTAKKNAPPMSPAEFIQRQFRYPAEDLRSRVEGAAYGYYEVSETGAVENRRVVGSLSSSIDAELRRALNALPNALAPPRHQGRPVRVAYVVPINLRIM
jgi:protein TonB